MRAINTPLMSILLLAAACDSPPDPDLDASIDVPVVVDGSVDRSVDAQSDVMNPDGDGQDGAGTCPPESWWDGTNCPAWTLCEPGSFEVSIGTETADRVCDACPEGMTSRAGESACIPAFAAVYALDGASCGLLIDGDVLCWGSDSQRYHRERQPGPFTSLSGGRQFLCGIGVDAEDTTCWGRSDDNIPSGFTFTSLDFSSNTSGYGCGLLASGRARCWTNRGIFNINIPLDTFVDVQVGGDHGCGLTPEGSIVCWGLDTLIPPEGVGFSSLAVGSQHACALNSEQHVLCWGSDTFNQITGVPEGEFDRVATNDDGRYSITCARRTDDQTLVCWAGPLTEVVVPDDYPLQQFSVGGRSVCGVDSGGVPICWGAAFGPHVTGVPNSRRFDDIIESTGVGGRFCATDLAGQMECWGGDSWDILSGVPESPSYLSFGRAQACAVVDGRTSCWGEDDPIITELPSDRDFRAVEVNDSRACAIRSEDDGVTCWPAGQEPTVTSRFQFIRAGSSYFCGVLNDSGLAECWGRESPENFLPSDVALDEVALGDSTSCGIRTVDGEVRCWGENSAIVSGAPVGSAYHGLSISSTRACAIRNSTGVPFCWGERVEAEDEPSEVFRSVVALATYACGIRESDETIRCWAGQSWNPKR